MKKKSFKTLFFLEFIACFLSFLHIASVSIQQWNPCAVALLWQDNRHISIRHYLQKDRQIEWYRAQFNDCGTHVRLESSYDDNTTLYFNALQQKYIEDYELPCERKYSNFDLQRYYREDCLYITNDDWSNKTIAMFEKFSFKIKANILNTHFRFKGNREFFLLPVQKNDGVKYVYLFHLMEKNNKKVLEVVTDFGPFSYPQCGAMSPSGTSIVICDKNGRIWKFQLTKQGLDKIEI